jgi:predicted esterase
MKHLRPFWRPLAALFFLTVFVNALQAQVQSPRYIATSANSGGFYEYLPQGYSTNPSQTYPVIIFLHGVGELGDGSPSQLPRMLNAGLPASINVGEMPVSLTVNGQTNSFIVISPQFINWPSSADVDAVINYTISHYRVNTNRIYLTGISMGGGVLWEYVGANSTYANRIAAIVPIAGASWPDYGRARVISNANIPVWAFHNNGDPTVPVWYTENYVAQINEAPAPNPQARKTIFNSGQHDAWTFVYNSSVKEDNMTIYQWMLQYSKGSTPPPPNNVVPVANAGPDQTLLGATTAQLNGSGTDADGSIATYNWTKVSGPAQWSLSNANIANPTVSNLTAGTYTFRLTVTDNQGSVAYDDVVVKVVATVPGRVEAESFSAMSGIQTETTTDAGGGQDVGWQDNGDWMDYPVNATTAGTYTVTFRVATQNTGVQFQVRKADGTSLATVTAPNTGGWQAFQNVTAQVALAAGQQTLRIYTSNAAGSGWNFNWMDFALSSTTPTPPPTTTYLPVPGRVEAEAYTTMSGIQTENTGDAGGGQDVGWQENNDWEDYAVNVATAGTYNVIFRVATTNTGVQFQLRNAAGTALATITAPNTGWWQTYQNVTAQVTLPAGQQTLRVYTTNAQSTGWNFNWMEFAAATTTPTPPATNYLAVPGRVEAEAFTTMSGIQTENTGDPGGGQDVGWQENNDWMDYAVNVATAGTYTVSFRVATVNTGVTFQLRKSDGTALATVTAPNTGWWQTYQTVTAQVTLAAGQQTLRIFTTNAQGSGWNFNWMDFAAATTTPTPPTPPSTSTTTHIEAESYTTMSGIQTENTSDAGGGLNVGWQENNDWMDYSVNVATAGTYTVSFRVATVNTGVQFQLRKSDGTSLATITAPNTGWWQTYQTVSAQVTLAAGQQTLRIFTTNAQGSGWNFNWWELVGPTTTTTPTPPVTTFTQRIEAESYATMYGIQTENTSDAGGGLNVGWQENNDWMDYSVTIPTAGTYTVNFRVATVNTGVQFQLRNAAGTSLGTVTVPNTGWWQTYQTVSAQVTLPAGQQTLRVFTTNAQGSGWNFNWWEITNGTSTTTSVTAAAEGAAELATDDTFDVYPNPVTDRFVLKLDNQRVGKMNVQIFNINGSLQKQFTLSKTAGATQTYLNISDLAKGEYLLKITIGDWTDTKKIIKL